MKFWKYQLNGNDFVLIHTKQQMEASLIRKLCDRHYGVGADGVMLVHYRSGKVYYRHFNSDGSSAGMCGNGIRCVAYWYMSRKSVNDCDVLIQGKQYHVCRLDDLVTLESELPKVIEENIYDSGVRHHISDHLIEDDTCNVDIVSYQDAMNVCIDTIELGAGHTLSCGTGNIAAFYHGYRMGLLHRIATISAPGGSNVMRIRGSHIYMSGIVHLVFQGTWCDH